jgi:hypothetical protein
VIYPARESKVARPWRRSATCMPEFFTRVASG